MEICSSSKRKLLHVLIWFNLVNTVYSLVVKIWCQRSASNSCFNWWTFLAGLRDHNSHSQPHHHPGTPTGTHFVTAQLAGFTTPWLAVCLQESHPDLCLPQSLISSLIFKTWGHEGEIRSVWRQHTGGKFSPSPHCRSESASALSSANLWGWLLRGPHVKDTLQKEICDKKS